MDLQVLQNTSASRDNADVLLERLDRSAKDNPHVYANAGIMYLSARAEPVSKVDT